MSGIGQEACGTGWEDSNAVLGEWHAPPHCPQTSCSRASRRSNVCSRIIRVKGSQKYVFHPKMLVVLGKETSIESRII